MKVSGELGRGGRARCSWDGDQRSRHVLSPAPRGVLVGNDERTIKAAESVNMVSF